MVAKINNRSTCGCSRPGLLTTEQAATYLGVSERCLRRWVQERKIIHHKLGKFVRFAADDLAAFVEAGRRDVWRP